MSKNECKILKKFVLHIKNVLKRSKIHFCICYDLKFLRNGLKRTLYPFKRFRKLGDIAKDPKS